MSQIGEYEIKWAREIVTSDPPFFGCLAVLIIKADRDNRHRLWASFPAEVEYVEHILNGGSHDDFRGNRGNPLFTESGNAARDGGNSS